MTDWPLDENLETAIDEAGRGRVFAYMRANGWYSGAPPKWVWWEAVRQVRQLAELPDRLPWEKG